MGRAHSLSHHHSDEARSHTAVRPQLEASGVTPPPSQVLKEASEFPASQF